MAMTHLQYLLTKLAEECQEAGIRALKCQQFGLDEIQPGQELTNKERLFWELNDIKGVLELLYANGVDYDVNPMAVIEKMNKIDHFRDYSVRLGMVEAP